MSNLLNHAINEFKAAGWVDESGTYTDDMQEAICNHVLKLLEVFSDEGHSGSTAPYAVSLFKTLAMFEPAVPLTGKDWEWDDVSEYSAVPTFQNKRCSRVFKDSDGAYDIQGKVFWEWIEYEGEISKSYFTSKESHTPVTFPYTPKTEYVFNPTEKFPNELLDPSKI